MEEQNPNQEPIQAQNENTTETQVPEKEIGTVRKITGELIGGFLVYGLVAAIIYSLVFSTIVEKIFENSLVGMGISAVVLNGVLAYFVWKISASTTFSKRSIAVGDISKVMKNMLIFTVIICLISACSQFMSFKQSVKKIEDNYMRVSNILSSSQFKDNEYAKQFNASQKAELKKAERPFYIYLGIMEVGITAVYIGVLPLLKKEITNYSV